MRTPRSVPSSLLRHSPLAAALACALLSPAMGATFVVTSDLDSGPGTLRDAMQQAQSTCDTNAVIQFNLPSPFTISPSSPLPSITDCLGPIDVKVTLDGYSQPGSAQNTASTGFNGTIGVFIDGSAFSFFSCALQTANFGYGEGGLALSGVEVRNFTYAGIPPICGAVKVTGSRIHSNSYGIDVKEPGVIGGAAVADRNFIYNNSNTGINAYSGKVDIINNYIGTDPSGMSPAPNFTGISMYSQGVSGSTIQNNLIAGNFLYGGEVYDSPGVIISGNTVGMNVTRSAALGNGFGGIDLSCSAGATVTGNYISGNGGDGLYIRGTDGGTIQSNKIGVAGDTVTAVPNLGNGVSLGFTFCGGEFLAKALRAKAAPIGGSSANSLNSNVIAHNSGHGIQVTSGVANTFSAGSIHSNGDKNIDLDFYGGPLPNDYASPPDFPAHDMDTGPNERQNHPEISLVTQDLLLGTTSITWTLRTTPGVNHPVDFFSNPTLGAPAGKSYFGASGAVTNASGDVTVTTVMPGLHDNISMTATGPDGSTSEFSPMVAVTPTPAVTVSPNPKNFGNVIVGSSLGPLGITVTSVGSAPYVISAFDSSPSCYGGPICSSGAFICANSCTTGTPYATSASCSIDVTFAPSVVGPASTTFYICDNAAGSPRAVTLLGEGVAPPPAALSISPAGHDFGTVLVGSSVVHSFTISNPGTGDATFSGPPTVTGPFQLASTTCGAILAASASCLANVRFVPVTNGNASGVLTVSSSGATASATLVGTGLRQSVLEMTSALIDLGSTSIGGAPLMRQVTLRNGGNAALTIDRISVGLPFTLTNGCPLNLLPGETCVVTLELNPTAVGTFEGSLAVVTNAPGGSRSVPVRGQVQVRPEPVVRVSPASIGFGDRMGGSQSPSQRVTVTNEGGADAVGMSFAINSPHFLVTNTTCGNVLAAQSTCFADVAFQPSGFGPKRASFSVNSTAPTAFTTLSGAGCRPPSASPGRGTRLSCAP